MCKYQDGIDINFSDFHLGMTTIILFEVSVFIHFKQTNGLPYPNENHHISIPSLNSSLKTVRSKSSQTQIQSQILPCRPAGMPLTTLTHIIKKIENTRGQNRQYKLNIGMVPPWNVSGINCGHTGDRVVGSPRATFILSYPKV